MFMMVIEVKKFKILFVITLLCLLLTGCKSDNEFKNEYEGLNTEEISEGVNYRELKINSKNPFVYANPEDIIKRVENNETFYVYFGSKYCPWCRSVIEKFIEVANKNKISTVYYIDIWSESHVEILRDTYKVNDDGKLEKTHEGTEEYYKLLELFGDVLNDYVIGEVSVGEKRIFAPTFIYVENGKAAKMVTGISEKQEKSMDELTEEILNDEQKTFEEFFNN